MAEAAGPLGARIRQLIEEMRAEWRELDRRIAALDDEFAETCARSDRRRPAADDDPGDRRAERDRTDRSDRQGEAFARARDLAAWLGLVPKQVTTGGKPRLLGISKRGNVYLRTLLIHGARAALPSLARSQTPLGDWLRGLLARAHPNIVVVALAASWRGSPGRCCGSVGATR